MVKKVAHNQVEVPDFFDVFGDELTGEITINRNFDDHPDASVQLIVSKDRITAIRERFKTNIEEKFEFYNIPFRLRGYTEEEQPITVYPEGRYRVTLDFEGFWSLRSTTQIRLRDDSRDTGVLGTSGQQSWADPSCGITSGSFGATAISLNGSNHPYKENTSISYISQLAERADVPLKGGDGLFIEYPATTSYATTTTLADAISRKFITKGLVMCWSLENPKGYVFSDAPSHKLTPSEIIAPVTYNNKIERVVYKDTELQWDKFAKEQADIERQNLRIEEIEESQATQRPEFEAIDDETFEITGGDLDAETPPQGYLFLNSYTLNWDVSGPTKVRKITKYQGSAVLSETEEIWGCAFTMAEIESTFPYTSISSGWQMVQRVTTTYNYDEATGYLTGSDSNGWTLGRYRQETYSEQNPDSYQTIQFKGQLGLQEAYGFQKFPIKNLTRYTLHQFSDYYGDSATLSDQYIVYGYCNRAGRRVRGYVIDPTYVPQMFAKRRVEFQSSYSVRANPFDNNDTAEPLTFGRETFYRENVQVYNSGSTVSSIELLGDRFSEGPDRFRKFIVESSSEDYTFQNDTNLTRMEEASGRPPVAQGKGTRYQLKEVAFENGNPGIPKYTLERKRLEKKQKSLNRRTQTTYLMTSNNDAEFARGGGSVSVETDIQEEAELAAKVLLEIQQFRQQETTNIVSHFNPQIKEGDFLEFEYNDNKYKRRVLRSTTVLKIIGTEEVSGELILTGATSFTLGPADTDGTFTIKQYDPQGNEINDDYVPYRDDGLLDVTLPPQRRGYVINEFDLSLFRSGRGT